MYGWNDTFERCADNRSLLDAMLDPGAEVACTRTFAILPLRYGAVCGTAPQRRLLPSLPKHLSRPLQAAALTESSYAVRPLRAGFLYILLKRKSVGSYVWHGQYRISEIGTLNYIDADNPWAPPVLPRVGKDGILGMTWMFKINDLDDVGDLRLLYSPAPLTKAVLNRYRTLPLYRDTLASIDVATLASATPPEIDNVLAQQQLELVADFAANSRPELRDLLKQQAFTPLSPPFLAARAEMMPAGNRKEYRGAAIVVDDALGITQELNAWRNASVEPLEAFMKAADGEKLTNHRKFTIAFAIENIKKTLAETAERDYYKEEQNIGVRYTDREYEMSNRHAVVQSAGNYRNYRNPQHQREVQERIAGQRRRESWNKYAPYLDENMRQTFLAEYHRMVDVADKAKAERATDHLRWLESEQFLNALDAFDRNDTVQGALFEDQMGKAIVGMNATAVGDALLERWRGAGISRENLFWRSLAQNQEPIENEIDKLFSERGALASLDPQTQQDRIKKLADLFDKSRAVIDELAQGAPGGPPASYLAGPALVVNTLGNTLFQSKLATAVDKPFNWLLANVLHSRLGRYARHFRLETRGGKALSQGAARRIDHATSSSFNDALHAGTKGPMTEVRIGGLLVILELWNLGNRLNAVDKRSKEYAEIAAAMVGLTAAGLEMGAAAAGFAERSGNAGVRQGARAFKSGLRLSAGVLAGGAATVGAWYDAQDFLDNITAKEYSISTIYVLRASVQTVAAALSIAVSLASAGPYLEYLIQKHGISSFFGRALSRSVQISSAMALRLTLMLRVFFGLNMVILALTIIEIFFIPDALERYLDHCTFRKNRSNGITDTEETEVEIMQRAIGSTL
ncbi:T6SS effector BTH_I2691 family protein [Achromobacter spanius]|uniref:T6SS effector BTH_I2691 family protein n=1 Tax=Achromobacter spanius TaxID=217203 RepID=UPI00320B59FA